MDRVQGAWRGAVDLNFFPRLWRVVCPHPVTWKQMSTCASSVVTKVIDKQLNRMEKSTEVCGRELHKTDGRREGWIRQEKWVKLRDTRRGENRNAIYTPHIQSFSLAAWWRWSLPGRTPPWERIWELGNLSFQLIPYSSRTWLVFRSNISFCIITYSNNLLLEWQLQLWFYIFIFFTWLMETHSSILAWRIPQTEEPGGLQSTGAQRVRHDWVANIHPWSLLSKLRGFCSGKCENSWDARKMKRNWNIQPNQSVCSNFIQPT